MKETMLRILFGKNYEKPFGIFKAVKDYRGIDWLHYIVIATVYGIGCWTLGKWIDEGLDTLFEMIENKKYNTENEEEEE